MGERNKKKYRKETNGVIERYMGQRMKPKMSVTPVPDGWNRGYWNGEACVAYRVVKVRVLPVSEPKMHWQNAFPNEIRQAIEINHDGHVWMIDNNTGQGLYKVTIGQGSPGVGHADISAHEFIDIVADKEQWIMPDQEKHTADRLCIEKWQEANFPEEFKKVQAAIAAWDKSPMNAKNIDHHAIRRDRK